MLRATAAAFAQRRVINPWSFPAEQQIAFRIWEHSFIFTFPLMELSLTLCQMAVYIRNDLIILYNQWKPFSEWRSQKHIIKDINCVQRNAAHSEFPTNHNNSFLGKNKNRATVSY